MKKIWDAVTQIGVTKETDSNTARRITYVNYIALLGITYPSMRILLSTDNIPYCFKLFVALLLSTITLLLNKFQYYGAAKIWSLLFYSSSITFFAYFYLGGLNGGAYVVLFSLLPLPFLFFEIDQKFHILLSMVLIIFCFILLIVLQYIHPLAISVELDMKIVNISTISLTILLIVLITWNFSSTNAKAEQMLLSEKEKIEAVNLNLQKALNEVKTLKGLVPICSMCKKIRDDNGYWNHLETYIEKHSDASFSHGMCNECNDKLYGKEDWYIKRKNKK